MDILLVVNWILSAVAICLAVASVVWVERAKMNWKRDRRKHKPCVILPISGFGSWVAKYVPSGRVIELPILDVDPNASYEERIGQEMVRDAFIRLLKERGFEEIEETKD